jgi:hypothetical protein
LAIPLRSWICPASWSRRPAITSMSSWQCRLPVARRRCGGEQSRAG